MLYAVLKYAGAAYLLLLAWKLADAGPVEASGEARGSPMTFVAAAAFQWINPKAWVMAVTTTATYATPGHAAAGALLVALVFGAVSLPSNNVWALFGVGLRRHLGDAGKVRAFNVVMALLLVAELLPLLRGG